MNQDMEKTDGSEKSQNSEQQQESNSLSLGIKDVYEKEIFAIVKTHDEDENNCFIAIGRYRLSDKMTQEECERKIDEKDWDLMASVFLMISGEGDKVIQKLKENNERQGQF